MFLIKNFPKELFERKNATLTNGILRGVEREALRITEDGRFAQTTHPKALGSALTHPSITTDFSESLLEFITPPTHRVGELFDHLESIHRYVANKLEHELLWTSSMPCALPEDEADIPVARYGDSHNGLMKTIYRIGLGNRYGRSMQTVAGIHYNFSLPNAFWAYYHTKEASILSLEAYKNERYFRLIRNFRRHYWLLILLFGASPAMCKSFVGKREHDLEIHEPSQALYRPYATSLRMGDLGYQSSAQESLFVCYNEKDTYIQTLTDAILKPHPLYKEYPTKNDKGLYTQLNQGLLQIENEFYSAIRPKRSAKPGETALMALHRRGVEYIEVRCLDINPFTPLGISEEQVAFLDTFLLFCALAESPASTHEESELITRNQKSVVNHGRAPDLNLEHYQQGSLSAKAWALALFEAMAPVAELLDSSYEHTRFSRALAKQKTHIEDLDQTPSARIMAALEQSKHGYPDVSLQLSRENNAKLRETPLDEETIARFELLAKQSISEQKVLEDKCRGGFDEFLANYYRQYEQLK